MSEKINVTVVGGGFSALTVAFFLNKAGFDVQVRNPQAHWGGLMSTKTTPHGLVEMGPNAIIADSLVEDLAQEIGIELLPHLSSANKKYLFHKKFKRWPIKPWENFSLLYFGLRFKLFKKGLEPKPGENLHQWGKRTLGEGITKNVLSVAMQGIYAAEAKKLSAELIVPAILNKKPVPPGKLKGSVAPRWGMGDWINGLVNDLEKKGVNLVKNSKLENKPKGIVVLATSLKGAKTILGQWGDHRGFLLNKIPLVNLISATIFIKPNGKEQKGFGGLFPRNQGVAASGVVFNNYVFEGRVSQGVRSETWIYSSELLKSEEDMLKRDDQEMIDIIKNDRRKVGFGDTELIHAELNRWSECIPLYSVEMNKIIQHTPMVQEQVYLHGNYLGGLGLAKILWQSRELARRLKQDFLPKD